MGYSIDQLNTMWTTEHIGGTLSVLSCIAAVGIIFYLKRLHTTFNYIMACSLISDFLLCLVFAISYAPFNYPGGDQSVWCQLLGFLVSFSGVASGAWNFILAYHCMRSITAKADEVEGPYTMYYYHAYGWGMGLLSVLAAVLAQAFRNDGTNIMGNASLECWISAPYQEYRLYLFYFINWLHFVLIIGIYMYIYQKVRGLLQNAVAEEVEEEKSTGEVIKSETEVKLSNASRRLLIKSAVISAAYIFVWVPGTASRIYTEFNPTVLSPFWLSYMHSLTVPIHGLVNSLIFGFYTFFKSRH